MKAIEIAGKLLEMEDEMDDFDPQVEFNQYLSSFKEARELEPGDTVIVPPDRIPQTIESISSVPRLYKEKGEPFIRLAFILSDERSWAPRYRTLTAHEVVKVTGNINDPRLGM